MAHIGPMIPTLNPYPTYKDSGVPWLGRVPAHWEVVPLGRYLRVKSGDMIFPEDERDTGVPIYGGNGIRGYTYEANTRGPVILVGRVGAKCGCVHLVMQDVWASEHALRVLPQVDLELKFLALTLEHADFNRLAIRTAQPLINSTIVRSHRAAFPPLPEQAAIVHFLDYMDRRIRRYIRAKQKLIKLLEEEKQAIIHRAVTGQVDVRTGQPYPAYKPSGVEWLGDVPEGWQVRQAHSLAQIVRGSTPRPAGSPVYFHGDAEPWITVGELTKDHEMFVRATATSLTPEGVKFSRIVEPGTLLLTNSGATLGVPKIAGIRGCINDGVAAFLRPRSEVELEFLYWYWVAQTLHLRAWVDLGAQPNLNTQIIGNWPVLAPSVAEQAAIVAQLDTAARSNLSLARRNHELIEFVREYRTRLIADVVTGKLDVREAAALLPDEPEEPDSLEDEEQLDEAIEPDEDAEAEDADT